MAFRKERKFNGKRYLRYAIRTHRGEAEQIAGQQRKKGYSVRLVVIKSSLDKRGWLYEVYLRR